VIRREGGCSVPREIKVGFVSHTAGRYGAELVLLDLIDGLLKKGVACTVLLPEKGPLVDDLEDRKVPYAILPYRWWGNRWGFASSVEKRALRSLFNLFMALPVAFRLSRWRVDVISTNTVAIPVGALASLLLRKPHIWQIHEFVGMVSGLSLDLGVSWALQIISALSDVVIVNSRAVYTEYARYIRREQLRVIYPSCNEWNGAEGAVPADGPSLFQLGHPLKLVIVGGASERKGQLDAVRALQELTRKRIDASLTIIGDVDPPYFQQLQGFIAQHRLGQRVQFTGYLKDPLPVMNAADLVLICSPCEAFGRVTVEAMRLGKPVIGTRSGGTPELIQEHFNGLLYTPGNFHELAERITCFASSPQLVREIGQNGQRWVEGRFTQDTYAEQMMQVLWDVVEKRGPVRS
jgi:glycosyltransferase involved in cell wall biosynthesis